MGQKPSEAGLLLDGPFHQNLTYEQNEWIIHLAGKLLAQEEETLSLMATNPFEGRAPPRTCHSVAHTLR
ncbi:Lipase maturation factor 1-like protein [Aix galericulata]|nr:Lipase maturation factor 1-like protein [Aix galericulata]